MTNSNYKLPSFLFVLITIGFIVWSARFINRSSFIAIDGQRYFCLFDDAMISMRYAWNFSHGLGLVWNSGEHVEGYTNLLMTLVMSLSTLVFDKTTAVLFIQALGVVFMLVTACLSALIADFFVREENHESQAFFRVIAFSGALAYYPLIYWTLMGMETGLLTVFLLLGVLSTLNYVRHKNPSQLLLVAGSLGLAYLTRNDSLIFAPPLFSVIVLDIFHSDQRKKAIGQLLLTICLLALFIVGQETFRFLYYGELLPNTYTLKLTGMPLLIRIMDGVNFVTPFIFETSLVWLVSIAGLVIKFGKEKLLLLSITIIALGYQIYVGGDPWNYWRIMSPSMPLMLILFISAVTTIANSATTSQFIRSFSQRSSRFADRPIQNLLIVLLTLIGLVSINLRFLPEFQLSRRAFQVADNVINVNTAILINQVTTSSATVGVYWAGTIPYFTDRKSFDFLGKSDRYIARLAPDLSGKISWNGMVSVPGHNKYDLNYSIQTLQPTYVQGFIWGRQDLTEWSASKYTKIERQGVRLFLLNDSPSVLWDKINTP